MGWQDILALGIVGLTMGLFIWNRLRPRRLAFPRTGHCGCGSSGSSSQSVVFRARRGETPRVVVKFK